MEHRVSASQLARRLADILGRVRYGNQTYVVERHGVAIARIGPAEGSARASLAEAARTWSAAEPDPSFATDLARVVAADRAPDNPWAS